jgi:hypothetical protein
MTRPSSIRSGDAVLGAVRFRITACPQPDCTAPAEVYADVTTASTHGPVVHVRTRCLNRHHLFLPLTYIPGADATTRGRS